MTIAFIYAVAGVAILAATPALSQSTGQPSEVIGSWQVTCRGAADARTCAIVQQQATKESNDARQRLLAVEIMPSGNGARGVMILPFGLDLDKGVRFSVEGAPGAALRFKTCIPAGCLVDLAFGPESLKSLGAASVATVEVTALENQAISRLSIRLDGFPEALDRARSLSRR